MCLMRRLASPGWAAHSGRRRIMRATMRRPTSLRAHGGGVVAREEKADGQDTRTFKRCLPASGCHSPSVHLSPLRGHVV